MSIDWENPFKPEDFDFSIGQYSENKIQVNCAKRANTIFKKIIKEYGRALLKWDDVQQGWFDFENYDPEVATHSAILICETKLPDSHPQEKD